MDIFHADKGYYVTLGHNVPFPDIFFSNTVTESVAEEKILENKLHFESNLKNICTKANQKLSALSVISKLKTFNWQENIREFSIC